MGFKIEQGEKFALRPIAENRSRRRAQNSSKGLMYFLPTTLGRL
jgi:hypothetical protein